MSLSRLRMSSSKPLPSVQSRLGQKTFLCDIVLSVERTHPCKAKRCESISRECVDKLHSFFDSKQHGVIPSPTFLVKVDAAPRI